MTSQRTIGETAQHYPMDAAPVGWRLIATNNTEQTMTAAAAADLVTISTDVNGQALSIPALTPIMVVTQYRKDGGVNRLGIGLKLNSTVVAEALVNTAGGGIGACHTTGEAQDGISIAFIGPREANYTHGVTGHYTAGGATNGFSSLFGFIGNSILAMPTVALTAIIIRGISDGTQVLGVKRVEVYVPL